MNKNKPIGKKTLTTIAGYNAVLRPKPPKPVVEVKETFEITPDLSESLNEKFVSAGEALGSVVEVEEIKDELDKVDGDADMVNDSGSTGKGDKDVGGFGDNPESGLDISDRDNEENTSEETGVGSIVSNVEEFDDGQVKESEHEVEAETIDSDIKEEEDKD